MRTKNNAITYDHSLNHALEFFSKAGSLFVKRNSNYGGEESALKLFQEVWITDKELALKLAFWLRNCRGGAGNRSGFRQIIHWLSNTAPEWVIANLSQIPFRGRWDDLKATYDTPVEQAALSFWWEAINSKDENISRLAAKWAGRKDKKLRKFSKLSPKEYRKILVKNTDVVESTMAARKWKRVEYPAVPSVAMGRYTNAFMRHDPSRFTKFKDNLKKGTQKINAKVLFPHDVIRTANNGSLDIAAAQFEALPNFIPEDQRILCVCDSSASMGVKVSGAIRAIDVAVGLSLYCSDRLNKENPFYRKFLQFESEAKLTDWAKKTFREVMKSPASFFSGAAGSTNIYKALDTLLDFGLTYGLPADQMPTALMIISDMQFDQGVQRTPGTPIEEILNKWQNAGYQKPKVIYWNTAGYAGSPGTTNQSNISLISGFSPSILKAVFGEIDLTPEAIMMKTLEDYQINIPDKQAEEKISEPITIKGTSNKKVTGLDASAFNEFAN